jgi:hypothetical protein
VLEQVWINVVAAALWRWIGRGRRPAWLLLSQLMGRALAFPLTLVIARIGGPSTRKDFDRACLLRNRQCCDYSWASPARDP